MLAEQDATTTPRRISINAMSNAVVVGVDMLTSVLLLAYILKILTKEVYGVWAEIGGLFAYTALLQLGLDSAINYFIPSMLVNRKHEDVNRIVSTSLVFYLAVSVVILLLTVVLAIYFPIWFNVAESLEYHSRVLVCMVGAFFAISVPLTVYQGVLTGMQRYVPLNTTRLICRLARVGLIIFLLWMGYGLIGLAVGHVVSRLAESFAMPVLAARYLPELRIRWSLANMATFREMIGYSIHTMSWILSAVIRYRVAFVMIGLFMTTASATIYTIPVMIMQALFTIVLAFSSVTKPAASALMAEGQTERLRALAMRGARYVSSLIMPLVIFLVVCGDGVVHVWVGEGFEEVPRLLAILLLPQLFTLGQSVVAYVLTGIGKPRALGMFALAMAGLSIVMMLVLVGYFETGLVGLAVSTAFPGAMTGILFLPIYSSRALAIPLRRYVWSTSLLPFLATIPFVVTLLAMQSAWPARSLAALVLFFVAAGSVQCISVYMFVLNRDERKTALAIFARVLRVGRSRKPVE